MGTLARALRSFISASAMIFLKSRHRKRKKLQVRRSFLYVSLLLAPGLLTILNGASLAADLSGQSPPDLIQTASVLAGYEFRAGVLGSSWGPEKGDPYLNGEVIFPKLLHAEGWADNFIPRLQLGGMGNLELR